MDIAIIGYFVLINIVTFIIYALDKNRARKDKYRIPEKHLVLLGVLGGSGGALMSMSVFRHKTQHKKFYLGIPLIILLQVVLSIVIYFLWKGYI